MHFFNKILNNLSAFLNQSVTITRVSKVSSLHTVLLTCVSVDLKACGFYTSRQITDVGGSIVVHTFGAYFGLAVSFMLKPSKSEFAPNELEGPTYNSDLFAMIGEYFFLLLIAFLFKMCIYFNRANCF